MSDRRDPARDIVGEDHFGISDAIVVAVNQADQLTGGVEESADTVRNVDAREDRAIEVWRQKGLSPERLA